MHILTCKTFAQLSSCGSRLLGYTISSGKSSASGKSDLPMSNASYTAVPGYFKQDDPSVDTREFNFTKEDFGLIVRSYDTDAAFDLGRKKTQWQRFARHVQHLNEASAQGTRYVVLFLARHGEGHHNVAERYYGRHDWDERWSKQPNWTDAHLTDEGVRQVKEANVFWMKQFAEQKMPAPQSYYTSPLFRCLQTSNITFGDLHLPLDYPFAPTIKELLRETIGVHTCDKRGSKTTIRENFPSFVIEPGFTEDDELWTPDVMEPFPEKAKRLKRLMDDVFANDKNTWISFTAHSGSITALLHVLDHRPFPLATAGVLPVLVKIEDCSRGRRMR